MPSYDVKTLPTPWTDYLTNTDYINLNSRNYYNHYFSFDLTFPSTNSEGFFNFGLPSRQDISGYSNLLIPFTITNKNRQERFTCTSFTTTDLDENGTITYADGTWSVVNLDGATFGYCNGDFVSNEHSFNFNVRTIAGNGNIGICQVMGTESSYYLNCPLSSNLTNLYRLRFHFTHNALNDDFILSIGDSWAYVKSDSATLNQINNNANEIKNDIKDSSIDNNNTSSSANDWASKNASNGTITQLLTLPISLLTNITNSINSSCSSFSLGTLFDTELVLPCINLNDYLGSSLVSIIDILFSGFMIYNIAKKLIKIFNDFTNLKSNQIDEIYGGGSE